MTRVIRAIVLAALLIPATVAAQSPELAGDVVKAQARLVESAREYRRALEELVALQEPDVDRAENEATRRRALLERGIVSRKEVEQSERALALARAKVDETRGRLAEADATIGEALAAIEIARLPKPALAETIITDAVVMYQGDAAVDLTSLEAFFSRRFGHALPVSARGQTATHDRLGLDHRHAVDVALHPDTDEGRGLIDYLRLRRIPFLAFRQAVPGASTGAHIHIGEVSPRLIPVRAGVR